MLLMFAIAATVGALAGVLAWWIRRRPIDRGSVSDAWRAEQRGRKNQ